MSEKIIFRTIIEVLGKPKEYVETSINGYIDKLKQDNNFKVLSEDFAKVEKREEGEMWGTFVELEVETNKMLDLSNFCFNYMPSQIEILEPQELKMSEGDMTGFMNDLQSKLHSVDMVAKQLKHENDLLKRNTSSLLKNVLIVMLSKNKLTSEQMSKFTGVHKDKIEDFLDKLIDQDVIQMKDDVYFIKQKK